MSKQRRLMIGCLALMWVGLVAGVVAQDVTDPDVLDNPILAAAAQHQTQTLPVRGTFTQSKQIAALPLPLESSGAFEITSTTHMVWQIQSPIQQRLDIRGDGVSVRTSEAEDAQPVLGSGYVASLFLTFFSGDLDTLQNEFELSPSGTKDDWRIQLVPRSARTQQFLQRIDLLGGVFGLTGVQLLEASGDLTDIRLAFATPSNP